MSASINTAAGSVAGPPRLWEGLTALPAGIRFLTRRRDCWLFAAVPCLCGVLLGVPLCWWALARLGPWLADWLLPDTTRWYGVGAHALVRWVVSVLGAYVGIALALALAPALSAPALEHLVRAQEAALGVPPRSSRGIGFELWCGLEAQAAALLVTVPLAIVCWAVGLIAPVAGLLVLPLQMSLVACGLAWGLLDYPLTLRGVRLRARARLLLSHPGAVLGFGAAFALATIIPGSALLLLPAGVVGATRLVVRLLPEAPAAV